MTHPPQARRIRSAAAWRALFGAIAVALLLVLYIVVAGWRGIALIGTGTPVGVALGAGVVVLPLLGVWFLWHEWRLGILTESMARELEGRGLLPVDDLPRLPSGRIDRRAADDQFGQYADATRAHPDEWEAWFNLGWAYDACGDRRRGRKALIHAARLRRDERRARRLGNASTEH